MSSASDSPPGSPSNKNPQFEYKATTQKSPVAQIESVQEKDNKATKQSNLKTPIESVHEKIKYPCHLCDKQFTFRANLKKHIDSFERFFFLEAFNLHIQIY